MKKYLLSVIIGSFFVCSLISPAQGEDNAFQENVWQAIQSLKSRGPTSRKEFVDIDTKRVHFPHKKHQELIKRLGKPCNTCHHRQKEGKPPRACRRCHARRTVVSKGKYTRAGRRLKQKDVFHFLCGDCHKKMSGQGYRRANGSPGNIPSKCHHCHLKKEN